MPISKDAGNKGQLLRISTRGEYAIPEKKNSPDNSRGPQYFLKRCSVHLHSLIQYKEQIEYPEKSFSLVIAFVYTWIRWWLGQIHSA